MKKLYTAKEISEILNISQESVWRFGRSGRLRTYRMGRLVRFFLPEELEVSNER